MNKNIDKLVAKKNKLTQEILATETLFKHMPAISHDIDLLVWHHSKLQEFSIRYTVKDVAEAFSLFDEWSSRVLPLYMFDRSGTVSFLTEANMLSGMSINNAAPLSRDYTVSVSRFGVKIEFYVLIGGLVVGIDIALNRVDSIYVDFSTHQGRYTKSRGSRVVVNEPMFFNYKHIKWWSSPDEPSSYSLYWL